MKSGEMRKKYNYLIKNTMWFTVANFSNKLIVFFLLPFYTAVLSAEEYAVIDLISITQQLLFPIITMDITEAVIRFGIEKGSNKKNIFLIGIFFIVVGNLLLSIICGILYIARVWSQSYIIYFLIFNIVISINTLYSSFLRAVDKVNVITISSIINTLLTTILNIYLIAGVKLGVEGYYLSFIIGNVISIIIMGFASCSDLKRYMIDAFAIKNNIRSMIKYSVPLIPNSIFWWVNSSLDRYFLTAMSGLSYVGMYAAANKIPSILNTVTSIVQQAWGLSLFKENSTESRKSFFDSVYFIYNELMFITAFLLILFTKLICKLLLSDEFYFAWTYVPILIFGFYFNSISSFIGAEFTAEKKTTLILSTTIISAIINIVFNILLIPKYSCLGAAIATCLSYFVLLESRIYLVNKKIKFNINNSDIFYKTLILFLISISTIISINIYNLIFGLILIISYLFIKRKNYEFFIKSILIMIRK